MVVCPAWFTALGVSAAQQAAYFETECRCGAIHIVSVIRLTQFNVFVLIRGIRYEATGGTKLPPLAPKFLALMSRSDTTGYSDRKGFESRRDSSKRWLAGFHFRGFGNIAIIPLSSFQDERSNIHLIRWCRWRSTTGCSPFGTKKEVGPYPPQISLPSCVQLAIVL